MNLLFIDKWFDNAVAKAIGWTLVHSLWQGVILSLVALLMVYFTRRSRSSLRYSLFTGLFFLFIGVTIVTFIVQWQSFLTVPGVKLSFAEVQQLQSIAFIAPVQEIKTTDPSLVGQFTFYFNSWCSWIIAAWFVVFVIKCVRFAISYSHVQHIRNDKSFLVPALVQKVNELATRLHIRTTVLVRESIIVNVPMTVGCLKPLILVPVGLINNLSAEQVEAILLHELAHIRRKDYLVNLIQCLTETVFFFNPAILWLSSLIREERENCCDDMAISVTQSKSTFVHALMAFQEYKSGLNVAPAFPGNKYPLLKRIQRIVYNNNKNLNNMEKIFLALGLAVTCLVGLAFSTATSNSHKKNHPIIGEMRVSMKKHNSAQYIDSIPLNDKLTGTITTAVDDVEYKLILKNDVITDLSVGGKKIDEGLITDYKSTTDKIIAEARERLTMSRIEFDNKNLLDKIVKEDQRLAKKRNDDLFQLQEKIKGNDDVLAKISEDKYKSDLLDKITEDKKSQDLFVNDQLKKSIDQNISKDINGLFDDKMAQKLFNDNKNDIFNSIDKTVKDKFTLDLKNGNAEMKLKSDKQWNISSDKSFNLDLKIDTSKPRKRDAREAKKRNDDGDNYKEDDDNLKEERKEFEIKKKEFEYQKQEMNEKIKNQDKRKADESKEFEYKMKEMREYQAHLKNELSMMDRRMNDMRKNYESRKERVEKDRQNARKDQERNERRAEDIRERQKEKQRDMEERKREMEERKRETDRFKREMNDRRESMIQELKNDKIIPQDAREVHVNIDDNEMIVNGVKQPDEVYKKYKTKFSDNKKKPASPSPATRPKMKPVTALVVNPGKRA